jgi:hypothetical protein
MMAASAGFAVFHHTPMTDLFGVNKIINLIVDIAKQLSINQASPKLCRYDVGNRL